MPDPVEVRAVNGDGPRCGCGKASALHLRPLGEKRGRFFCTRCVVDALWVEAPVSPPEEPEQELTFHDDDRWEPDPAHARVEELEAALREILWRRGDPSVVRQVARRALRGSVPAGEDENG